MAKYDELDALILNDIGAGPTPFHEFAYGMTMQSTCLPFAINSDETWRVVDRRLQALRKKGLIASTGKGWVKV